MHADYMEMEMLLYLLVSVCVYLRDCARMYFTSRVQNRVDKYAAPQR